MNVKFKAEKPETIEMTLTVTMTLSAWIELKKLLPRDWPAYDFGRAIAEMVEMAEQTFRPEVKND